LEEAFFLQHVLGCLRVKTEVKPEVTTDERNADRNSLAAAGARPGTNISVPDAVQNGSPAAAGLTELDSEVRCINIKINSNSNSNGNISDMHHDSGKSETYLRHI